MAKNKSVYHPNTVRRKALMESTATCVDCGEEGLVFEGSNEYEPDPKTGEKRCWRCDMKANPKELNNR